MMRAMDTSGLSPQAIALLERFARAGVRPVSEQTPAVARRAGLRLMDLYDHAAGDAAIIRHLNRTGGDRPAGIAAACGIDGEELAERLEDATIVFGVTPRGSLAVVALTFFLMLLFWDSHRIAAAGAITLAYAVIGVVCACATKLSHESYPRGGMRPVSLMDRFALNPQDILPVEGS